MLNFRPAHFSYFQTCSKFCSLSFTTEPSLLLRPPKILGSSARLFPVIGFHGLILEDFFIHVNPSLVLDTADPYRFDPNHPNNRSADQQLTQPSAVNPARRAVKIPYFRKSKCGASCASVSIAIFTPFSSANRK